jgi:hypothetical protein
MSKNPFAETLSLSASRSAKSKVPERPFTAPAQRSISSALPTNSPTATILIASARPDRIALRVMKGVLDHLRLEMLHRVEPEPVYAGLLLQPNEPGPGSIAHISRRLRRIEGLKVAFELRPKAPSG